MPDSCMYEAMGIKVVRGILRPMRVYSRREIQLSDSSKDPVVGQPSTPYPEPVLTLSLPKEPLTPPTTERTRNT
jgi:hypothetical protein